MEDVAPRRTSSPPQGEARRPTKRGQLMLTHQDTSKGPSQARPVGPPGEAPGSIQVRSAMLTHLERSKTPSQAGTSAHQARSRLRAQPREPTQARHVGPPSEAHTKLRHSRVKFPHRETLRKARHVGPPSEGSHESQNREGRVGEKDRPGCRPV